jgi:hypothetical protein
MVVVIIVKSSVNDNGLELRLLAIVVSIKNGYVIDLSLGTRAGSSSLRAERNASVRLLAVVLPPRAAREQLSIDAS